MNKLTMIKRTTAYWFLYKDLINSYEIYHYPLYQISDTNVHGLGFFDDRLKQTVNEQFYVDILEFD